MKLRCDCGHNEFNGQQLLRVEVIVDQDGQFLRNQCFDLVDMVVYDADDPFGPFTCAKCGKEVSE